MMAGRAGYQPPLVLLDREAEREAIGQVLDAVRGGFSGSLVLKGGPGAGKTALLKYATDQASGFLVVSAIGVQSQISLEFGGVHQLLAPFTSLLDVLPPPQRQALRVALGLEAGEPPDRCLVALAVLTTLSCAAEEQPLLAVIDDAQWLDGESVKVLAFVARRLCADRVGMILAVGEPDTRHEFEHLPAKAVGPLPEAEAVELLHSVTGGPLDDQEISRILDSTQRNPLALVELGAGFTREQLAGRAGEPEPLPLRGRLAERFQRQIQSLPPDAQHLVLLAAADVSGERSRLYRAAEVAGIDIDAAAAAVESAGLLRFSGRSVRLRHPLIRSAACHGSIDRDRRCAHLALSKASDSDLDLSRRAWHRACATVNPDEDAAAGLERAAVRARGRGGCASSAAMLRRAVELTPDDSRRAQREVALADAELTSGDQDTASDLIENAMPRLPDNLTRGQAKRLYGQLLAWQGRASEAADVLAAASRALAPDVRLARDTILEALRAAIRSGPTQTAKIVHQAQSLPRTTGSPPVASDLLLEGYLARFTRGYQQSIAPFRAAIAALLADDLDPATGLRWFSLAATAAGSLWDDQAIFDLSECWVHVARKLGALAALPAALAFLSIADLLAGRFDDASMRWAEMRELTAASRSPGVLGVDHRGEGLLLAYRGQTDAAREAGVTQVHQWTARGQRGPADIGWYVVAVANLCAREYDAAVSATLPVIEDDPAFTAEMALPELVEAAARSGNRETAARALDVLSERALAAGTPWALGLRARGQALVDEGETAQDAYQESIARLKQSRAAVDLARTHLLYGQWLRRAKRRRDARHELRTACEMFATMGAEGFTEIAAAELRSTGERARARTPETTCDLTPRETHVAELAADGSSNKDIAAQLFISPGTVEYHLGRVFRKLNVTSRGQLARRLSARAPSPAL
jgi:DNA-binding CsgD family transcriptional regulator